MNQSNLKNKFSPEEKEDLNPHKKGGKYKLYDLQQKAGMRIRYANLLMEFDHLDGMYSYNIILEGKSTGKVFHLNATTPLYYMGHDEYEVPEL